MLFFAIVYAVQHKCLKVFVVYIYFILISFEKWLYIYEKKRLKMIYINYIIQVKICILLASVF